MSTQWTLDQLTAATINHYEQNPQGFWEGTKDHDVSQNYEHFLKHLPKEAPYRILDLGCGPGRDLKFFSDLGHEAYGLDGCEAFCQMARAYSGCEVYHQNYLAMELPENFFHGIFANASLFHIPKNALADCLSQFHQALRPEGILFSSNPRGQGESISGQRYGHYMELTDYRIFFEKAGFSLIEHYYRPDGIPVEQRSWLACVLRKQA